MARIVSLGMALQNFYLIDHDDLKPTTIGNSAIFGKILVGSKVEIDRNASEVGGSGLNAAVTFSRHNHETILFANIAEDPIGSAIIDKLNRESIDSSYVNILSRTKTGTSTILLDAKSGDRTILTCHNTSNDFSYLNAYDLDNINPDWLYVSSLSGNFQVIEKFMREAKKLNAKIAFNPGEKELENQKELTSLFKYVDVLILNKQEASRIVPGVILTELLSRLNNYVETVIITDNIMGGIASNRSKSYRFGIYEEVNKKDATGAGDAFASGFIAHLADGKSFKSSLTFASANATMVIQKIGSTNGILTGRESLHPMPIQEI